MPTLPSIALARRGLAALASELQALPPYPAALWLASAGLCIVETALIPGPRTFGYALVLGCMLVGFALLGGTLLQLTMLALARADRRAPRAVLAFWPLLGTGAGLELAQRLGAFEQLGGRNARLAQLILVATACGGLVLGVLVAAMQPRARAAQGSIAAHGPRVRALACGLFVACAALLSRVDQTFYIGLYWDAHSALRLCAALAAMLACVLYAPELRLPRLDRRMLWLGLLLSAAPVVLLQASQVDTIAALLARPWPAMLLRSARDVLDLDGDGFAWALGGGDCNDFDARINPSAHEIADNGIDDNCILGDRKRVSIASAAAAPLPDAPAPINVVLVTIDSLRWDRLGTNAPAYGPHGRDTMPELTRFARDSVSFSRAYTPGAWTSIALGAILRGVYARHLSFVAYYETTAYRLLRKPLEPKLRDGEQAARMFPLAFGDAHPTLPEWLARRGMNTLAVVDDGFSRMLSSAVGAARGFEHYREVNVKKDERPAERDESEAARDYRDDAATADIAISLLQGAAPGRFFLWVHMFGPHAPSNAHPGVRHYGPTIEDAYDHEVRYTDMQLARILSAVRALPDPTAVFVSADHGEDFFGSYRAHGTELTETAMRVPLIAHVPGWQPRRVDAPVNLVDLMPTILALTRTPLPPHLDGIDLSNIAQGKRAPSRLLFSDVWQYDYLGEAMIDLSAAYDGRRKLVLNRLDQSMSAYDQTDGSLIQVTNLAGDPLALGVLGYLEDAGGPLDLRD